MTEPSTLPHATAVRLRAAAAWLESHPDAKPQELALVGDVLLVKQYASISTGYMRARAVEIGGEWSLNADGLMVRLVQPIAPDVDYQLLGSRDRVDPAKLGFEPVGRAA